MPTHVAGASWSARGELTCKRRAACQKIFSACVNLLILRDFEATNAAGKNRIGGSAYLTLRSVSRFELGVEAV